jgi:hypothetical protein
MELLVVIVALVLSAGAALLLQKTALSIILRLMARSQPN